MFAIAAIVSIFLLSKDAKNKGFDEGTIVDFSFWLLIFGIIGARIFYIFLNLPFFKGNLKEIFMFWHGGLVWYGGLIFAAVFGIIFLKIKKLPILKTLDLMAPYAALGQSIGRIGCFLNGCCFGKPEVFFPVQLISTFNLLSIFLILKSRQKKSNFPGEILFLYLMLASLERFIMEFFRGDSPAFFWNLTIFQIISLIIFIFSFYGKILLKSKRG